MKIQRPVKVKVILTESSKRELEAEYQQKLDHTKLELEQLRFQGKKLLHEAQKKSSEQTRIMQEKLKQEEKKKFEEIDKYQFQIEQLQMLPIGTEVLHSTLESEVEMKVGDLWDEIMESAEIIIKDGVVHEIREGRE